MSASDASAIVTKDDISGFTTIDSLSDYLSKVEGGAVSGNISVFQSDLAVISGKFSGGENAAADGKNSFAFGAAASAYSDYSNAIGLSTFAGLKGYKYTNVGAVTNSLTFSTNPIGWEPNDKVSIVNNKKYESIAIILLIDRNIVTFTEDLPFASIKPDSNFDAHCAYVLAKPTIGDFDIGIASHVEGISSQAKNYAAHAEGFNTKANGQFSHAEGHTTVARYASHAEGRDMRAYGEQSHAEGKTSHAFGNMSHAEGDTTVAEDTAKASHAEGYKSKTSGIGSHAEGGYYIIATDGTIPLSSQFNGGQAIGPASHAEGVSNIASGKASHAEGGIRTNKSGNLTVSGTTASGESSHSEGYGTTASGDMSHVEGNNSTASGDASHAEGFNTLAYNYNEHAEGRYNKSNYDSDTFGSSGNTLHSIGIGTANTASGRKNAVEVMQNGDVYIFGIGGYNGQNIATAKTLQQVIAELAS